jgi:phosphate transport system protein
MVATTRSAFDRKLNTLQDNVLSLAEMVESQLPEAVKALQLRDMDRARRVNEFDLTINRTRYDLEEQCYTLLALQQPAASDMRRIVSTVSLVTNLERMGDHAAGIARIALRTEGMANPFVAPEFDSMVALATTNLRDAMTALATHHDGLAREVAQRDCEIDQLHKNAYNNLIKKMSEDSSSVECATLLLWVSHNIERYADRISNMCDRIIYIVTGNLYEPRHDPMP